MADEQQAWNADLNIDEELPPAWKSNEELDAESELTVTEHRDQAAESATHAEQQRLSEALEGDRAVPEGVSEDVASSPARRGRDHPERDDT